MSIKGNDTMKFEMTFNYLDTENKVVKAYDIHPLYEEIKNTFDTFLGSPVSITNEKYTKTYRDFNYLENIIPMIKHTLIYTVSWNEISHLNAMVKLLEQLDLDCEYTLKED